MQNNQFEIDFAKERKILFSLFFGEIFFLFFGLVFSLTSNTVGNAFTFAFSGLGIILLGIILLILFRNYRNLSIVKRKNLLLHQHNKETQELENVRLQKKDVESKRSDLHREKEQKSLSRRRKHEQLESESSQELIRINKSEKDAFAVALSNLQSQYINIGMRSTNIPITEIPGIGSKTRDLLHDHGIHTAYDVEYNRILKIPGIGESKTQALVKWALLVANHYRLTKPTVLPRGTIDEIQKKHTNLRIGVEGAKRKENIDFTTDLDYIEREYLEKHTKNDEAEKSLDEEAKKNRLQLHELHAELETYKRITFKLFLIDSIKSLNQTFNVSGKRVLTSWVLITIFLISSLCILEAKSTTAIVQSIIPTFTPTATVTNTPTITHTPTFTFTPTNSFTPTISLTPTKTSTVTKTPTFTRTVTVTRTNTRTRLPTATYNPNVVIPIVPIVPVAPAVCPQGAMAICADGRVSYSQNRRGTCSHHGGVAQWCQ